MDVAQQRMTDLKVRGTMIGPNTRYPNGYLVFSVIDFIQHARTDTPTYADATCLFRYLKDRLGEDFTRHVFMIKLPRGNSTYRTPTMTLKGLHTLLPLLGDKVEPEFRRIFEEVYHTRVRSEE